jgi:CO/xanthine dehydrogenase Mo-binding subunit
VLVDEIAAALPLDPIEFRRRNALKTGGPNDDRQSVYVSIRTLQILDKLETIRFGTSGPNRRHAPRADLSLAPGWLAFLRTMAQERTARSRDGGNRSGRRRRAMGNGIGPLPPIALP